MKIPDWMTSCWSSSQYSDKNLDSYIAKVNGIINRRESGWRFLGDTTRLSSLKDKIITEYQKPSAGDLKTERSSEINDLFTRINKILLSTDVKNEIELKISDIENTRTNGLC